MPVSPKHAPRRAHVTYTDIVAEQLRKLDAAEMVAADRAFVAISTDPQIGETRQILAGQVPIREYVDDATRVLYFVTALGTVVVVAYIEV